MTLMKHLRGVLYLSVLFLNLHVGCVSAFSWLGNKAFVMGHIHAFFVIEYKF
jgi:hypothetical protein